MNGKDQVIALLFALTALTSPDLHMYFSIYFDEKLAIMLYGYL